MVEILGTIGVLTLIALLCFLMYLFGFFHGAVFSELVDRPDENIIILFKEILMETRDRYKSEKKQSYDEEGGNNE